jgi:hypothetical protein
MTQPIEEKMKDFAWLYGLDTYFDKYKSDDILAEYKKIKEALLRGNVHSIKDLILAEIQRGYTELTDEFVNLIMHSIIDYEYLNHRKLIRYLSYKFDDEYLRRISLTTIDFQSSMDLNAHFSRGQFMSKLWLIDELKKIEFDPTNIAMYGGWYATIYQLLLQEFPIEKFRNYEIDHKAATIAERFNYKEVQQNWKFKSVISDVGNLWWKDNSLKHTVNNLQNQPIVEVIDYGLIINTSCEHMDETWFHNVPPGKLICLQTNDYFDNVQHINCVHNEDDAAKKYPMSELLFKGTLNTPIYNRFMLIGRK